MVETVNRSLRSEERSQTAIEYLLLISAAIMLVVIVTLLLRGNVFGGSGGRIGEVADQIWKALRGV